LERDGERELDGRDAREPDREGLDELVEDGRDGRDDERVDAGGRDGRLGADRAPDERDEPEGRLARSREGGGEEARERLGDAEREDLDDWGGGDSVREGRALSLREGDEERGDELDRSERLGGGLSVLSVRLGSRSLELGGRSVRLGGLSVRLGAVLRSFDRTPSITRRVIEERSGSDSRTPGRRWTSFADGRSVEGLLLSTRAGGSRRGLASRSRQSFDGVARGVALEVGGVARGVSPARAGTVPGRERSTGAVRSMPAVPGASRSTTRRGLRVPEVTPREGLSPEPGTPSVATRRVGRRTSSELREAPPRSTTTRPRTSSGSSGRRSTKGVTSASSRPPRVPRSIRMRSTPSPR
jgi:hypothetical protein